MRCSERIHSKRGVRTLSFFQISFPRLVCGPAWLVAFAFFLTLLPGCREHGVFPAGSVGTLPADTTLVSVAEIDAYRDAAKVELLDHILPFWMRYAPDPVHGGFHSEIRQDLTPDDSGVRGVLMDARVLWTFSAVYRRFPDPRYADMAKRARDDLFSRFEDRVNGGFFWSAKTNGKVADERKILYAQAFVLYALSEDAMAFHDEDTLQQAVALYQMLEEKCRDRVNGGYHEEFSRDWQVRYATGWRSVMGTPGVKSQNVHIHMLEAYTNLYRAWPDAGLLADLEALQDLLENRIVDPSGRHLVLFFRDDWTPLSRKISYGHDIEFSWLITDSAQVTGDAARVDKARKVALSFALTSAFQGQNAEGGIFNEGLPDGTVTDATFDWWPQAEAATAFLNVWRFSRDDRFFRQSVQTWDFIEKHMVDSDGGEWFRHLDARGNPVTSLEKAGFWKCPYHNSRACLRILDMLDTAEFELSKQDRNSL